MVAKGVLKTLWLPRHHHHNQHHALKCNQKAKEQWVHLSLSLIYPYILSSRELLVGSMSVPLPVLKAWLAGCSAQCRPYSLAPACRCPSQTWGRVSLCRGGELGRISPGRLSVSRGGAATTFWNIVGTGFPKRCVQHAWQWLLLNLPKTIWLPWIWTICWILLPAKTKIRNNVHPTQRWPGNHVADPRWPDQSG